MARAFSSFPMDEPYLLQAVAYVELNPVMAGMVDNPWDYAYSGIHAHLLGFDEMGIIKTDRMLALINDWKRYLKQAKNNKTGGVLGSDKFIKTQIKKKIRMINVCVPLSFKWHNKSFRMTAYASGDFRR